MQQQKPRANEGRSTPILNPTQQDKNLVLQQLQQVLFELRPTKDKDTYTILFDVCHVDKDVNITNENVLDILIQIPMTQTHTNNK